MPGPTPTTAEEQNAELRTELAAERVQVAELTQERDRLRASHELLRLELELLRRRLFVAKAERVDTRQLQMDFAAVLAALDAFAGEPPPKPEKPKGKKKPTGRRDLSQLPLEEERVEIPDDEFEKLVGEGKARRCGFEMSYKLAYKRGGARRLAIAKVRYALVGRDGEPQTAQAPVECFPRSLAAPSMLWLTSVPRSSPTGSHSIASRTGPRGRASRSTAAQ